MDRIDYTLFRRVMLSVLTVIMPCLSALADRVDVADANGNLLRYSYDTADGPATFTSVRTYAQDASKAGRIIIADAVTDANGVSHEVKYVDSSVGSRGNLVSIVFGRNIVATCGADGSGSDAFSGCKLLESVTLNAKLETLGRYCFRDCIALTSINLSAATSLTTIKYDCFENCDALESVTLPASVTMLEDYAFYGCDALKEVKFATSSKELTFGKEVFRNCKALSAFTFPQNLVAIGDATFDGCEALASVTFNGSSKAFKTIPYNTFASCTSLTSITLPDEVEELGVGVFYNCTSLREITFGKGLISLGDDWTVFGHYMQNLKKLTFPGANYPFKRSHAMNTLDVTLYVHPDLVDTYRTSEYTKWYHIVAIGHTTTANVSTSTGGQLESKVRAKGDPADLLELTVSGPLNGTDINFLHQQLWGLEKLDLGNARIVAGGDQYAIWLWDDNQVSQYGYYLYSTEDNVVGDYMFYDMPCLQWLQLPSGTTAIGEYAICQERGHGARFRLTYCPIPSGVNRIGQCAFLYAGITEVSVPKGVTELPHDVFLHCEKLQKVTLPEGLKTIGRGLFNECYELIEVNMPSTVETIDEYAFQNNYKRTTPLVIPNSCKTIGNFAFQSNYVMPSVKFGNSVETIGRCAFAACRTIEKAELPETVTQMGDRVFQDCDSLRTFKFPKNIKQVPDYCFEWCDNLTSVTLADGTTRIADGAFSTCVKLTSINLTEQKSLTFIGCYAFYMTALQGDINLPNQITEISYDAFRACPELVSINVPTGIDYVPCAFVRECPQFTTIKMHPGIRTVKSWAFENCPLLTTVDLNDQITSIEEYAFYRAKAFTLTKLPEAVTFLGHSAFRETAITGTLTLPTGLKTMQNCVFGGSTIEGIVIPEGMTGFGIDNFYGCKSLTSVKLPSDMVTVPTNTFHDCTALESIDLPEGLTNIDYAAFCNAGLTSITLPEGIKRIESSAFENTKLTTFRVPDGFTDDMGSYALQNCKLLRTVYFGRNQDYSQWSSFTCVYGCDSLQLMRVYAGVPPKSDKWNKDFRFNCVLEVPEDQVQLYKEADFWKEFKDIRGIFMGDILADRDFALMQELYDKLGGANWPKPWDLSNNHHAVGKWAGITTVRTGDTSSQTYCISTIDLSGQGLKGTLPASLFRLPELTKLNLSNNQIEGDLTTIISGQNTAPLTEVNLQGNRLTGDIYAFASKLPELTKLNLSYNQLTDISQPVSKEKLASNNFVYNYQFIDYTTHQTVAPEGAPVVDITVGVPATIEMNRLITYRHNDQDYGFTSRDLGRIYYSNNNGWNVDWELYQTDGLWNLYQNDGDYYRTLKAKKGEPTPYSLYTSNWQTILLRFTWVDGDVNTDQTADVQDLQSVIHYALNDRKPMNQPFNFGAADDNSDDKVNVIDITRSVAYVLSNRRSAPANTRRNNIVRENSQNLLYCMGSDLLLTNADEVAAMQFDVMGASQHDINISPDVSSRFSVAMDNIPGGVRVVLYSPTGNALPAGTHKLMMQLPAGATVGEAVLTNQEARRLSVSIDGEVSTTINELGIDPSADLPIYDLGGRQLGPWNTLPAGIYVVRKQGQSYLLRK